MLSDSLFLTITDPCIIPEKSRISCGYFQQYSILIDYAEMTLFAGFD